MEKNSMTHGDSESRAMFIIIIINSISMRLWLSPKT